MIRVNIHEAKSQLSRLIEAVEAGEEVVIARAHRPVVRLVPFSHADLELGDWDLGLQAAPDWDAPETNAQVAALFHRDGDLSD